VNSWWKIFNAFENYTNLIREFVAKKLRILAS